MGQTERESGLIQDFLSDPGITLVEECKASTTTATPFVHRRKAEYPSGDNHVNRYFALFNSCYLNSKRHLAAVSLQGFWNHDGCFPE